MRDDEARAAEASRRADRREDMPTGHVGAQGPPGYPQAQQGQRQQLPPLAPAGLQELTSIYVNEHGTGTVDRIKQFMSRVFPHSFSMLVWPTSSFLRTTCLWAAYGYDRCACAMTLAHTVRARRCAMP